MKRRITSFCLAIAMVISLASCLSVSVRAEEYQNGWVNEDGAWRYYDSSDGTMTIGWKQFGKVWYYFKPDGVMATEWQKIGGYWYFFAEDYKDNAGVMATGWRKISGTWYYFRPSGTMVTGWQKISGYWYYFKSSGAMATGWQKISGCWYYFKTSGVMATGWQKIGGYWYYLKSSGVMATDWLKIDGIWYYFKSSGIMATGRQKIGGKWYSFNSSGVWLDDNSYCHNLNKAYPKFFLVYCEIIQEYPTYYECKATVLTGQNHWTPYTGPKEITKVRIKKNAKVIYWTSLTTKVEVSLSTYMKNYGYGSIRIDEYCEHDSAGYIVMFRDTAAG